MKTDETDFQSANIYRMHCVNEAAVVNQYTSFANLLKNRFLRLPKASAHFWAVQKERWMRFNCDRQDLPKCMMPNA